MKVQTKRYLKPVYAAMCLALAMVLPLVTGQIQQIGSMLCPMHIPVLLCGMLCGWQWGLLIGFISPFLRFLIFTMPPLFPIGTAMAFELAAYGTLAGILYKALPKKIGYIYLSLIGAMVGGRIVWGIVRFAIAGLNGSDFPFSAFVSGAITTALPGIALQIVLIPLAVLALRKARLTLNE